MNCRQMWALLMLWVFVTTVTASESPLTKDEYRHAAQSVLDLLVRGNVTGADDAGKIAEQRGWRDGLHTLSADPAFTEHTDDADVRQVALRSLLVLLDRTHNTSAKAADPLLLDRIRPLPGDPGEDEDSNLPQLPASWQDFATWLQKKLEGILHWLGDLLKELLRWLIPKHEDSEGTNITQLIVGFCLVLVTGIVCVMAILWWRRSRLVPMTAVRTKGHAAEEAIDRPVSEWERRGDELIAAGDYRGALRAFFHAALAAAFAAGHLHHRRGRTNWEYLALVAARNEWRADLVTLVVTFERSWYGGHATSAADCHRFRQAVEAMSLAFQTRKATDAVDAKRTDV